MNGSENRRSGSNTSACECCVLKVCAFTELSKLCNIQSSTNLTTNKSLHSICVYSSFDGDYSGTDFNKHETFSKPMSMCCNRRYKFYFRLSTLAQAVL